MDVKSIVLWLGALNVGAMMELGLEATSPKPVLK